MALVAVNNKQLVCPNRPRMRVKVFKLGKRQIVINLACRAYLNNLVAWEILSKLG
jgi:hypothetical protein